MSMEMLNINSSHNINIEIIHSVFSRSGPLFNPGRLPSVYLVDRELMDAIFPPEIVVLLDRVRVRQMMASFDREFRDSSVITTIESDKRASSGAVHVENGGADHNLSNEGEAIVGIQEAAAQADIFWERMADCVQGPVAQTFRGNFSYQIGPQDAEEIRRHMKIRIPFSAYLGEERGADPVDISGVLSLGDLHLFMKTYGRLGYVTGDPAYAKLKGIIEQHEGAVPHEDAIFICMDRIVGAAQKIKDLWSFRQVNLDQLVEIIFSAYLMQQLARAHNRNESDRYFTSWGRVIEENLIIAYSLSCFDDELSREVVKSHIARQPLGYRGYAFFENLTQYEISKLLRAWSQNNVSKALKMDLIWNISGLPLPLFEKASFGFRGFFASRPEKFWKILATEIVYTAIGE